MKGILICWIVNVLLVGQVRAQVNINKDSVQKILVKNSNDLEALSLLGQSLELENMDTVIYIAQKLLQNATLQNENYYKAKAYQLAGNYFIIKNKLDSAQLNYEQSIQYADLSGDKLHRAISRTSLAQLYLNKGETKKGFNLFNEALPILKSEKDSNRIRSALTTTYGQIGDAYYLSGVYDKALEYQFLSLQTLNKNADRVNEGTALSSIGAIYTAMNNHTKSREYFSKAINLFKQEKYDLAVAISYYNIAEAYFKESNLKLASLYSDSALALQTKTNTTYNLGNVYMLKGAIEKNKRRPTLAETYYLQALALNKEAGASIQLSQTYEGLAGLYTEMQRYNEAEELYMLAKQYFEQEHSPKDLTETYKSLIRFYLKRNNIKMAAIYFEKYDSTATVFLNSEKAQAIANQEIKYETSLKEATIVNQQIKIDNQNRERLYYIIAALLTLLGIVTLSILLGRMKKQKQIIERQKDEILHNNRNNLQQLISIFNRQAEDEAYRDKAIDNQGRLQTLTLLNKLLYDNKAKGQVDMKQYTNELCTYKQMGLDKKINIQVDVKEVLLKATLAKDIGLMINELMTNSIKYAFTQTNSPEIIVTLKHINPHEVQLLVKDNGQGLNNTEQQRRGTSLGLGFVEDLVKQHHGEMKLYNAQGLVCDITLKSV